MTGIVHFRNTGRMSRRAMIAGVASMGLGAAVQSTGAAQTPVASPVTRGGTYLADARDRLRSLLALLPEGVLGGPDPTFPLFDWLDLEVHFHALGIADPASVPDDLGAALAGVYSSDELLSYAVAPEVREVLGFSAVDVHRVLVAGVPPDQVTIYAGGVPFADLTATWEAAGYVRRTGDAGDSWSLSAEGEPDFELPLPLATGAMHNVALIGEDIAIFTRTSSLLERIMAHQADSAGSPAVANADLATLIETLPVDTVNVLALPGETFRADTMVPENPGRAAGPGLEDLLAESDAAVGPMPLLLLGMIAVTSGAAPVIEGTPPGGDLQPRALLAFLTGSEDDARAAADVAFWRLENMQSPTTGETYRERFVPVNTVDDAAAGPVMTVAFGEDVARIGTWMQMVLTRDTWPFAWLKG